MIKTEMPALLWIGGAPVPASTGETFPVLDPATEEVIGEAPRGVAEDIDRAVDAARAAARSREWRDLDPFRRGRILLAWARRIDAESEPIARLLSRENGKPLSEAIDEVETTVRYIEYYAGWADKFDGRVVGVPGGALEYVLHEPLGVVGQVVPWNYPLDVFARGVAPALTVGNTIVAKPSAETPLSTLYVASLSDEAGMPPGVLNVVSGFGADAGAHLAGHGGIDGLAFCGSVATGREVLRAAAERITPVVSLELGGKSAKIVFDDADLDAAASAAAHGITYNAGQSCGTQSRVLVPRALVDEVAGRIRDVLAGVRIGPGLDDPDMGPLVSEAQLDRVIGLIESGRAEGAEVVHGGGRQRRRRRSRLLHRADAVRRGAAGDADRPGGDLRAGRLAPALRLGGGGDRDRERDGLRPVGVRLDSRRRSRASGGTPARRQRRRRQRGRRVRRGVALGRGEAERLRPGGRRRVPVPVLAREGRLDRCP